MVGSSRSRSRRMTVTRGVTRTLAPTTGPMRFGPGKPPGRRARPELRPSPCAQPTRGATCSRTRVSGTRAATCGTGSSASRSWLGEEAGCDPPALDDRPGARCGHRVRWRSGRPAGQPPRAGERRGIRRGASRRVPEAVAPDRRRVLRRTLPARHAQPRAERRTRVGAEPLLDLPQPPLYHDAAAAGAGAVGGDGQEDDRRAWRADSAADRLAHHRVPAGQLRRALSSLIYSERTETMARK